MADGSRWAYERDFPICALVCRPASRLAFSDALLFYVLRAVSRSSSCGLHGALKSLLRFAGCER